MTKHDTERSRTYEARNKRIMELVDEGETHKAIGKAMGMGYDAVKSVVGRERNPIPFVSVRGDDSTERSRRQRALHGAGVIHAKGHILGKDHEAFKAMVKRALPAVQRATKGETE